MNQVVSLLCILVCITTASCDRVYVHPFYLINYNTTTSCEELEILEPVGEMIRPVSIESDITPDYEESLRNKIKEESEQQNITKFQDGVHIVGARFYGELREIHKGENIILSPSNIYESLLSFYLGASGETARNLTFFLVLNTPPCTKIDGHKVLSAVRLINGPFHPKEVDGLLFSKLFCLFAAPGVHLAESFIHKLDFPDIPFYVRAVDFTNSTQAVEKINAFVAGKHTHRSKSLLTDVDPETNFAFATYTQFKAIIKGATLLKEPQEFWLSSDTKISVPMMRITGTFQHQCDGKRNLFIVKIPISNDVFLLLLQPANNSDLAHAEALYSMTPPAPWLDLSPRKIHLTFPKVSFESMYNLQDSLAKMSLRNLLGEKPNLSMLSDTNLTVGKIINQQLFELNPEGADEAEVPLEQDEDTTPLSLIVDKPFLIAVYGKSNTLLYFGRVTNPLKRA